MKNIFLSFLFLCIMYLAVLILPENTMAQPSLAYRIGIMGNCEYGGTYWVRCASDGSECSFLPPTEFECP